MRKRDELLYAAKTFKKMIDNYDIFISYEQSIDTEQTIKKEKVEVKISFKESDFHHLTGIEKLKDLDDAPKNKAIGFLDKVLDGKMTYYKDFIKSSHINRPINSFGEDCHKHPKSTVDYFVIDRLREIKSLFWYLKNATKDNMYIYKWNDNQYDRPYNSSINSDYLLVFHEGTFKQINEQTTCFFIAKNNDNTFSPVTIFPTDIPYSYDVDHGKKQVKVDNFSLKIINKRTKTITNIIEPKQVDIDEEKLRYFSSIVSEDYHKLNKYRTKLLNNPDNKANLKQYKTKIERLGQKEKYGIEKLSIFQEKLIEDIVSLLPSNIKEKYRKKELSIEKALELLKDDFKIDFLGKEYNYVKKCKDTINTRKENITFMMKFNDFNIDGSGAAVLSPAASISLSEQWNNIKENLQNVIQSFADNFKLTIQSLGKDIKKIGSDIKRSIGNTIKDAVKPPGKYEIADRSAEIKETVALPQRNTARKTGMNVNTHEKFVVKKDERVAENERNRTDRPQDRGIKRNDRDI